MFNRFLKSTLRKKPLQLTRENYLLNFSSLFSLLNLTLYSLTTCCENSRMMVGILPYSFIAMINLLKLFRNKSFSLNNSNKKII